MKKNLIRAVALAIVIAASSGCVNNDYDLKTLDPSLTILPGLKIHVKETEKQILKDQSYLTKSESVIKLENDELAIAGTNGSSKNAKGSNKGGQISFDNPLYISTASWINGLLPGVIFNAPLVPVLEVINPTNISLDLYGTAKCGDATVNFGPYKVKNGTNRIKLEMDAIQAFFMPVKHDVEISNLRLAWNGNAKVSESDEFTIEAYAPLSLNPGDRVFIEYPVAEAFIESVDLQEKAEKHHISVESLSVNVDIVNSFPLDLAISAKGELDNGPASASISPSIAAGSMNNPVSTSVVIKANLAKGAHSFKNATVCLEGKVTGNKPVSISADQNISYTVNDITLDSGITLGL